MESPLCLLCRENGESMYHNMISECKKLAQKKYKRRHNEVARFIHWELCGKYGIPRIVKWHEHQPEGVLKSGEVIKVLCDGML